MRRRMSLAVRPTIELDQPADNSFVLGAMRSRNFGSFRLGQSGNPRGRTPGTRNRVTIEAQLAATELVDDPAYRDALRQRMIAGTAGAMEPLIWIYSYGKAVERVEHGQPGAFAELSSTELKARLLEVAATL